MKERFQEKFDYRFYGNPKKIAVDPDEVLPFIESELTLREKGVKERVREAALKGIIMAGADPAQRVIILDSIDHCPPTSEDKV